MTKKLNIEIVRKDFYKEGYILVSKKYINNKKKLKYLCSNGHKHYVSWNNWSSGTRCPYCSGKAKPTIDFIKSEFRKKGFILLTNKYFNNKQKLDYICTNGHKTSINWANFQKGTGCGYCANKIKKKIVMIKKELEKYNYKLLSNTYNGAFKKLKFMCYNGHKHSMRWNDFQQGKRCWECRREEYSIKYSGKNSPSWKGGLSCEPYCDVWLDKEFKESIKERDGFECQNPNCWETSNRLIVHHVDYNKKNCNPNNLITLCNSCNARANINRHFHTEFYKDIMFKRGLIDA